MFDDSEVRSIGGDKGAEKGEKKPKTRFNYAALPVDELIRMYDEIKQHLPPTKLSDLNLEEEVLLQFHAMRALQGTVMSDDEVPVNQRAQVANGVANILEKLGDMQSALYSSERFKDIENVLIRSLNLLPEAASAEFLTEYEKRLRVNAPRT